jgi:hypothetical protein
MGTKCDLNTPTTTLAILPEAKKDTQLESLVNLKRSEVKKTEPSS